MSDSFTYCSFEGRPTIYTTGEAWWLIEGEWKSVNAAEVATGATIIRKAEFDRRFAVAPPRVITPVL